MDERGTRGTLIFTSATGAVRGNVFTAAFAAGKFAERALSQSLAKAYGKQNIHVRLTLTRRIFSSSRAIELCVFCHRLQVLSWMVQFQQTGLIMEIQTCRYSLKPLPK